MSEHEYEFDWIHKPRRRHHSCLKQLKKCCCSCKSTKVADGQPPGERHGHVAINETMQEQEETNQQEEGGSTSIITPPEERELLSKLTASERDKVKEMRRKNKKVKLPGEVKSTKSITQQLEEKASSRTLGKWTW